MKEEIHNPQVRSQKRDGWRRRLMAFFVALSVLPCLAAAVGWVFGLFNLTERGSNLLSLRAGNLFLDAQRFRGAVDLSIAVAQNDNQVVTSTSDHMIKQRLHEDSKRTVFATLDFSRRDDCVRTKHFILTLPYWLLILTFGSVPCLWLRRRYIERRDKKLFAEAVASKRREQGEERKPE